MCTLCSVQLFKKTKIDSYNMLKRNQNQSAFKKYVKDYLLVENDLDLERKLFYGIHYAFIKINNNAHMHVSNI